MKPNCVTTTIDLLTREGGRFVAAGSRRGPLMHVWHESADGTVTRYEPDAPLRHWMHAFVGYPGHTVARPQVQARPMTPWQLVASVWALAFVVSVWAVLRWVRRTLAKPSGFRGQISEHKGGARPESCEEVRPTGDDDSRGSTGS